MRTKQNDSWNCAKLCGYGRKEIIVRGMGGGSGLQETDLSIYRMANGALYRIFRNDRGPRGLDCGNQCNRA